MLNFGFDDEFEVMIALNSIQDVEQRRYLLERTVLPSLRQWVNILDNTYMYDNTYFYVTTV